MKICIHIRKHVNYIYFLFGAVLGSLVNKEGVDVASIVKFFPLHSDQSLIKVEYNRFLIY